MLKMQPFQPYPTRATQLDRCRALELKCWHGAQISIVLEYMDQGSLADLVKKVRIVQP